MFDVGKLSNELLLGWANTYRTAIVAEPEDFGLTAGQAAQYVTVTGNFAAKLAISTGPATRTRPTVAATKASRDTLVALSRDFIMVTRRKQGMTDETLLSVGIEPYAPRRHERPAPTALVIVDSLTVSGNSVLAKFHAAGTKRSKAPRSIGANIFTATGEEPPVTIEGWFNQGLYTRNLAKIDFDPTLPAGTKVWFAIAWVGATGILAAASPPQSVNLQSGTAFQAGSDGIKLAA